MLLLDGAHADPRLSFVDPRTCLFRLANDTRFHKDKAPYKTWLSAWLSPGGKNGAFAGYYLHLNPGASHVSAGIYVPTKPALLGLRSSFADERVARGFDRLFKAKAIQPLLPLETSPLRVMPRGFSKEHPRAAFMRARNFLVSRDVPDRELLDRGAFATVREMMRAAAPLVRWLDERANVAGADWGRDDEDFS